MPIEPPLLAIGIPRSGFSLLISVLIEICEATGFSGSQKRRCIETLSRELGSVAFGGLGRQFERADISDRLLFNENFRPLAGGPRWIDVAEAPTANFRKYVGARGMGDFTIVTRHPPELLLGDRVVHSHSGAGTWPGFGPFRGHARFASIRNPFAIVNSACFSINALASAYLQSIGSTPEEDEASRQTLALYKLSDPRFFGSLVAHLKRELDAYLPHRSRYTEMRWESLIDEPVPTILALAGRIGVEMDPSVAAGIWDRLGHRNLTGAHRHNFRTGYGIVGDWRNWLVNWHLDFMRDAGLAPAIRALGYDADARIDPAAHTPFQHRLADALAKGEPAEAEWDRDLFVFAFNKTNIDFGAFGFRQFAWRRHTRIERSCFSDPFVESAIWDEVEAAMDAINAFLGDVLPELATATAPEAAVRGAFSRQAERLKSVAGPGFERLHDRCISGFSTA